jgi:hypothetical protein
VRLRVGVFRQADLPEALDQEPAVGECVGVRVDRPVDALQEQPGVVARDLVDVVRLVEVRAVDYERCAGLAGVELAGRVDRVDDREAEVSGGDEDAGGLVHHAGEVRRVLERHERDDEVER